MAIDPITAVVDLVKVGLDKFVSDKMSEKDKNEMLQNMEMFMAREAMNENSDFRRFVVDYEGAAKDVPRVIVIVRSLIRPCFTILVGYMDFLFFTGTTTEWAPEAIALLKAVNVIVLAFWFGERALKNSGLVDLLIKQKKCD